MGQKLPQDLYLLIALLKKLPGVGTRTAERFAFEWMSWPEKELQALGETLQTIHQKIPPCPTCGCLTDQGTCHFCDPLKRDTSRLCILASPRDAYAIEETLIYKGLYHVVEHLLSPLDNRHASTLRIDRIEERLAKGSIQEVILAFDSTLEADATALYLKQRLTREGLFVSRLAFGLPMGSNLESIDGGTLIRALQGRQSF